MRTGDGPPRQFSDAQVCTLNAIQRDAASSRRGTPGEHNRWYHSWGKVNQNDAGRFKTPSLRNVGLKASMMHVAWVTDVQDAIHFYNAPAFPEVGGETGHTQYTQDQSGIPTAGGGAVPYSNINMPEETEGGVQMQALIIDFVANALTDPRVAAETFPFDRPPLRSERPADLDGDGDVDAADLAQLLGAWGPYELCPPFLPADFDQDCAVGAFDLAVLLGNLG